MKKIIVAAVVSFTVMWALLTALEKLLDAEMPEWMREQVNGL